ncbi:putative RNA polymerase II transcription factor B subunit 1 [Ceratocystis platani]|uniref:Putative RNA polymerase II transcription factor B subunit 1 n=1 Tax=Ceratocystis fimbriata f. sp. platani TaxID=88771 RepID=A0A0F8B3N2_CERFI|nr:putative RNA polymerase II transcription factor B subunit 1 [Ceratocystis platani]
MPAPTGQAAFKKKDGIIGLTLDNKHVTWTPVPGNGPPTVSLAVANITNLQQTPDSAPKVMLKIFEKGPDGGEAVSYLFHFNTPEARPQANAVKDALSNLITGLRSNDPNVPKPAATAAPASSASTTQTVASGAAAASNGSVSGSMAFAAAVKSSQALSTKWFDDNQLKVDIELQQSLMKKDRDLHQTYMEARRTKPEAISDGAFNSQFWSTRTNLLRAHAIETHQKKGAYNVLSTVKPRTVDGELKLNISVEQVQMIFAQHPLVKRIYNENVPKLSEGEFWSRFFLSKLSKMLRGERVTDADNRDALFDRYDAAEDTRGFYSRMLTQQVPAIIDIEANEEDQGGMKTGNRADVEMRPRTNVPIVKTLNSLSEKIMAHVAPSDADPLAPKGLDESTYNQLLLHDLQADVAENRIMLNVKEQNLFFTKKDTDPSSNATIFTKQDPKAVLQQFQAELGTLANRAGNGLDLHAMIGVDDAETEVEIEASGNPATGAEAVDANKPMYVGSRAARQAAEKDVLDVIVAKRNQVHGDLKESDSPLGLSPALAERCTITHATTMEFLNQFWTAFLSGDPDRAGELPYLVESLKRSAVRIYAVGDEAEKERNVIIEAKKTEIRDYYKKTGKKLRWKADSVGGGKAAVVTMMRPTLEALAKAEAEYKKALAAEGILPSTE